jgi:hypothetical protein
MPIPNLASAFCMTLNHLMKVEYICIQDRLEAHVVRRDPKLRMILPSIKQIFWTSLSSKIVLKKEGLLLKDVLL